MLKNIVGIVTLVIVVIISACDNDGKDKALAGDYSPVVNYPPPEISLNRTALVIGNSDYQNDIFPRLENPVNDAKDLAVVLRNLGFEVIELLNANRQDMNAAIRKFRDKLVVNQGVGLFYFSGHGVDYAGKNHLIPLDNKIKVSYNIDESSQTIAVNYVLNEMQMAENHLNFLILDACRKARKIKANNKPYDKGINIIPDGLKVPNLVRGFLIAYAAAPGKAALSGVGERNSPYVKHLIRFIQEPNLSVEHMFKKVGAAVVKETNQVQEPGYYTQLYDAFSFNSQKSVLKPVVVDSFKAEEPYKELVNLIKNQLTKSEKDSLKIAVLQAQLAKLTKQLANSEKETKSDKDSEKIAELEAPLVKLTKQLQNPPTPVVIKPPTSVGVENKTFVAGKVFRDKLKNGKFGPEMVWIPAGSFKMGDIQGGGWTDEKPVHSVSVRQFAMGKYEVTFSEYDKFAKATGREKPDDEGWARGDHPVINVSWYDATAYAKWLSDQTGKQYRLPTEAEWEYAARAGTETKYWWGNQIDKNRAICNGCDVKWGWDSKKMTAPVGSFSTNPFDLYDTIGNVWEWTCSEYEKKYNGKEKVCVIRASSLSFRGGSWDSDARGLRSAYRGGREPSTRSDNVGFRLTRL